MTGKTYVVGALAGAVAVLVGAGAALAQDRGDRLSRCEARLASAAERRGVSVEELEAQLEQRMTTRVDAALRAGRISPERAMVLRERISQADLCKPARVIRIGAAKRGLFRAAAAYLRLDLAGLRAALPGTSLAALAERQGKSVDGLEAAMLAPARARLARAVEAERITQARADRALALLERQVARLVQKEFPAR